MHPYESIQFSVINFLLCHFRSNVTENYTELLTNLSIVSIGILAQLRNNIKEKLFFGRKMSSLNSCVFCFDFSLVTGGQFQSTKAQIPNFQSGFLEYRPRAKNEAMIQHHYQGRHRHRVQGMFWWLASFSPLKFTLKIIPFNFKWIYFLSLSLAHSYAIFCLIPWSGYSRP